MLLALGKAGTGSGEVVRREAWSGGKAGRDGRVKVVEAGADISVVVVWLLGGELRGRWWFEIAREKSVT